jgi:hypothetical protein
MHQVQGGTQEVHTLFQETDSTRMFLGELRVASFPNKTNKQNNTTKLDEQKGPPEADKFSSQQDLQRETPCTPTEGEKQNPAILAGEFTRRVIPRAAGSESAQSHHRRIETADKHG